MNSDTKMICRSIDKLTAEVIRLRREIKELRKPIYGLDVGKGMDEDPEDEGEEECQL